MEVVYINFKHKSFNWANGMYIIVEEKDDEYRMCKLDENGQAELHNDGRFVISCTGKNNKDIQRTNLRYYENIKKQTRKEKLDKICIK